VTRGEKFDYFIIGEPISWDQITSVGSNVEFRRNLMQWWSEPLDRDCPG